MEASSTVAPDQGGPATPIVLVRDGRWPELPGVCCWRRSLRAAFADIGGVAEITITPPGPDRPAAGTGPARQPRLPWLPTPFRQPLVRAYRASRRIARRVQRGFLAGPRRPAGGSGLDRAALAGAALVIGETIDVAMAAAARGAPRHRVWALALPADRLNGRERAGFAVSVARAAEKLGGLLTDSETARDSLERAAAATRPRVVIFPPVAADRPCPEHATESTTDLAVPPDGLHPAAGQLALWRRIVDGTGDGAGGLPDTFAAARLRGAVTGWAWSAPPDWPAGAPDPRSPAPPDQEPPEWSADAQLRAARQIWDAVAPSASPSASPSARGSRAALVAGHDLKFARDLAERLGSRSDLRVEVDEWRALSKGTEHTEHRLREAESIFAEWARTSAIWYSQRKRPDQLLAVRLHRFELDAPYPREIVIDNVDAVVYIAPLFGRRIRDELDWPVDKLVYIPNFLDLDWLDRPKLPEARFALGFVGIEWRRKRFDLALDLLAELRREDPRFVLIVRSIMPWHNKYAWEDPGEREYVGRCFERIDRDPWLRHAVSFDEPGRDMARWYRRVGHIVSTSDEEGCHTAVGEGMASGAVPVVRPWPGADEIYDKEWVHTGVDDAVAAVLASADPAVWSERAARARAEIRRSHDPVAVVNAWADLLHGDLPGARTYFSDYSRLTPGPPAG